MKKSYYPELDETLYSGTLENGLDVLVVPKKGFTKKLAYFVTDYGSIHTEFDLEGKHYSAPAGVAHYLEHKMFDLPGGRDVSAEFATMGAMCNAFTSYDMTAYYFSCTQQFELCLRLPLPMMWKRKSPIPASVSSPAGSSAISFAVCRKAPSPWW